MLFTSAMESFRSFLGDSTSREPRPAPAPEDFPCVLCASARRSSRSFWTTTFSILFEKIYTAGASTRDVAVNCLTCWTVWSLRAPISEQPCVHLAAASMWYRSCVRCRMTLTLESESRSLASNATRSFFNLRSTRAMGPWGFSTGPSAPWFLQAMGQLPGSPVQLEASEDLIKLKQLLHMISRSSMSVDAALKEGRVDWETLAPAPYCVVDMEPPAFADRRAAALGSVFESLCK
mmetsp:Transcript_119722/g.343986  ORF Transcript_119722/g.343986 Transcript_119722/m.343986 type:complete len:234 (-) Transcript_119722:233-934(-)